MHHVEECPSLHGPFWFNHQQIVRMNFRDKADGSVCNLLNEGDFCVDAVGYETEMGG